MIAPAVWILINLVTKPRPLIKLDREIAIIYGIVHNYILLWTKFGIWKGRNSRLSLVAARTGDSKLLLLLISKRIRFDGAGKDLKRALR